MEPRPQIESLFQQALQHPPAERDAWLREACDGNSELQREVASLLTNHQNDAGSASWAAAAQLVAGPASLEAGQRLGPYEILAPIGAGGMGKVYRARDTRLKRDVAIKVCEARFSDRFEREARVIASLSHPNICQLYDVGANFLVMELVEGETLSGPLPVETALNYARQIAEALEAAHEKGVVHRDLKPANVKVTPAGVVKVLDFGLAKAAEESKATGNPGDSPTVTTSATRAGMILGTAAYMSPEQARGATVDKRTDIWAFGVVLFEMLTGSQLFAGETISDTLAGVLRAELDWSALPRDTPLNIRRLLRRCLERDRKRRLRDIGDARWELDAEPPAAEPETAAPPKRLPWLPWGIAALSLGTSIWLALSPIRTGLPQAMVQSSILAPEKVAFYPTQGIRGGNALSPDGLTLAFVGSQDGKSLLWVQRLDSMAARPLPETENAYQPFWSPDSRSIGFFAGPQLKRVDVAGGPAQVICDATGGRGGTWNSEGTIVFALTGGLFRVSAAGGQAVRVATRGSGVAAYWPWFLPDGRHFLHSVRPGSGASRIMVDSIDGASGSDKPFQLQADSNAMYVPGPGGKGWLLFAQRSTLFAQRFDAGKLEIEGEPAPIADHVAAVRGLGFAGFSVSQNSELVYSRNVASRGKLGKLVFLDREGKPSPVAAPPGQYWQPRLSPDGTKLAVSMTDVTGNEDIWIVDLAHGNEFQRFTFDPAQDVFPLWSPDGKQIAFVRAEAAKIFAKAVNGAGDEETITSESMPVATYDWSRDGRYILHLTIGATTGPDLFVYDLKKRKETALVETQYNESQGQFSPDGHWVAYSSDESSRYEVYVRSFTSNSKFQISANGGGQARWRGDGKELYYISEGNLMVVPIKEDAATFTRGTPRVLFEARALVGAIGSGPQGYVYDVTSDGKRFLVIDPGDHDVDQPLTLITNWQAGVRK